ncbi:hypothetical protein KKC60_03745 [Patescibacteria group bacterium]|nr:hypothetical protein [Patescibacteria group bacterium]
MDKKSTRKYTLRITKNLDHFLEWKVQNTKLSKAQFIRIGLMKIISDDKEYQNFLSKFELK